MNTQAPQPLPSHLDLRACWPWRRDGCWPLTAANPASVAGPGRRVPRQAIAAAIPTLPAATCVGNAAEDASLADCESPQPPPTPAGRSEATVTASPATRRRMPPDLAMPYFSFAPRG